MKSRVLGYFVLFSIGMLILLALPVHAAPNTPKIDYSNTLPKSVQSVVNSAVDVEYTDNNQTQIEKSSGVKISDNLTLSVGHEFLENGPMQDSSSNNYCRNLSIFSPNDRNSDQSTDSSILASYYGINSTDPDISLINTSGDSEFNNLPTPTIGAIPLNGSSVYMVNYEPDSNLIDRNPNPQANPVDQSNKLSNPAIYSGLVLDTTGGRYTIATGINSYGIGISDTESRPGASGGPVYNSAGQLIGITVAIDTDPVTPQEIANTYDVDTSNIDNINQLQIEEVQPITQNLIDQYTSLLSKHSESNLALPADTSSCIVNPSEKNSTKPASIFSTIKNGALNIIGSFQNKVSL